MGQLPFTAPMVWLKCYQNVPTSVVLAVIIAFLILLLHFFSLRCFDRVNIDVITARQGVMWWQQFFVTRDSLNHAHSLLASSEVE